MFRSRTLVSLFVLACAGCSATPDDTGSSESAVTKCGQTTVKGVDVYHLDNGANPIDWVAMKKAGASFAFVKATESTNYIDASFKTNWAGLKSAGMVRGAYHFFHSDVDPVAQANYFLAEVGVATQGDLLVLDLESPNGQTDATILKHAITFMTTVQTATGLTPLLYTSPLFLSSFAGLGGYPLWVANYGVSCPDVPAPWKNYTFWQSTGTGSFPPIKGAVDLDTFNGTLQELQALGGPFPTDGGASDAGATDGGVVGSEPNTDSGVITSKDASPGADGGFGNQTGGCSIGLPRDNRGAFAMLFGFALVIVSGRRYRRRQ